MSSHSTSKRVKPEALRTCLAHRQTGKGRATDYMASASVLNQSSERDRRRGG